MKKLHSYKTFESECEETDWPKVSFLSLNQTKLLVTWVVNGVSFGLLYLITKWIVQVELFKYQPSTPQEATHVLVTDKDGTCSVVQIHNVSVPQLATSNTLSDRLVTLKLFSFRFLKYYYNPHTGGFSQLRFNNLLETQTGTSTETYLTRKNLFGDCLIDVPMPSVSSLLANEILHPFFVFQIFSIILWFWEKYYLYSSTILVLSVVSVLVNLFETRKNIRSVREMALYECFVSVFRDNQWVRIQSRDLVPGDLIQIPEKKQMPCDAVLTKGNCLVDESMLTGESQPVLKEQTNFTIDKKSIVSAGTKPLKGNCLGLVSAIGFSTTKGELVRSILFPKPNRFKFYSDSFKFIGFMGVIAVLGFIWCIASFVEEGMKFQAMMVSALDLVTIIVPPALPLAMTVGTAFAVSRLKTKKVTCISPPAVNAAGRVSVVCFDKTGTLTRDSMELLGVWDFASGKLESSLNKCSEALQQNMGVCHSLNLLDGQLVGDPQEITVFQEGGWEMLEGGVFRNSKTELKRLQLFNFNPSLKRMGAIVQSRKETLLQVKGAPEVVIPLCQNTTNSVRQVVNNYTKQGLRVLACAYKSLSTFNEANTLVSYEKQLNLAGLLLIENPLKADAQATIETLQLARVKCLVSTGDALLTGVAVAKSCRMLTETHLGDFNRGEIEWQNQDGEHKDWDQEKSLAVTGDLLEYLVTSKHPLLDLVMSKSVVFGRMSPQQKVVLVEQLQSGFVQVAMVGDGANDCGALKAADVGLSLSQAEASIAAPFTGANLKDIEEVLKEGRASLVTSFQNFKFIIMYSMIQFMCVNMLYLMHTNMLDSQFLYQDLFVILPLAIFMAYTRAYEYLAPKLPAGALISFPVISSVVGQLVIQGGFQVLSYLLLVSTDFYRSTESEVENPEPSYENTVLFLVSSSQLLFVCISFSIGPPFRETAFKNYPFTLYACFVGLLTSYLVVFEDNISSNLLELKYSPVWFRLVLLGVVMGSLTATLLYEKLLSFLDY